MKEFEKGEKLIIDAENIPEAVHAIYIEKDKDQKDYIIIRVEDSFLEDINHVYYSIPKIRARKYKER